MTMTRDARPAAALAGRRAHFVRAQNTRSRKFRKYSITTLERTATVKNHRVQIIVIIMSSSVESHSFHDVSRLMTSATLRDSRYVDRSPPRRTLSALSYEKVGRRALVSRSIAQARNLVLHVAVTTSPSPSFRPLSFRLRSVFSAVAPTPI